MPAYGSSVTYCEEAATQLKSDSNQWLLQRNTVTAWDLYDLEIWNLTSTADDIISIFHAKGFRKKVYPMSYPEGIVFIHNGKQVAAYQQAPRYLWVHKELLIYISRL